MRIKLPAWWPWLAVAGLLAAGGALLAHETRGATFWADEWEWILNRRGGGAGPFLDPHNSHLSLVPVAIYKALFAIVGLRHYWPYLAVMIVLELTAVLLLFIYARRRVGDFFALVGAALILFFGPGWQDMVWPFQIAWLIAIAAGVGALLALDRHDRVGDVAACVLLAVALGSAGPGLAIAVGLVVELLLTRRRRDLWIAAIPIVLYGLWWLGYQQAAFNRHSLLLLPRFVFNSAAGTLSSITGLADVNVLNDSGNFLTWGAPLLVVALAALVWRVRRLGRIPPRALTLMAILLAFWLLTGIGRAYVTVGSLVITATGDESRYLYVGAAFLVLLVAELWRGAVAGPRTTIAIGVLAALAILSNIAPLRAGAALLRNQTPYTTAELATLDLSRQIVKPSYVSDGFIFGILSAGPWFAAEKALGYPAPTPQQIAGLPEFARQAADAQLIKIRGLALRGLSPARASGGTAPAIDGAQGATTFVRGGCVHFAPSPYTASGAVNAIALAVPVHGIVVGAAGAPVTVGVRRFSSQFRQLGTVAPGTRASLTIPPDLAPQPWHVQLAAGSGFTACGVG